MADYELKPRSSHWLPRLLNKFGGSVYWMTLENTIYYPDVYDLETAQLFTEIIEHEKIHIEQYKKYGTFWFLFLYVLVPVPIFFSYFRWKFERRAYLVGLKYTRGQRKDIDMDNAVEEVVRSLWSGYWFPWPKTLMRSWFKKQLKK